jgi:DMSO/TMAO reductase YedYZ molybdopterin-dependent catalytic subunit
MDITPIVLSRRVLLAGLASAPASARQSVNFGLEIAPDRALADPYAGKRQMIIQRSVPPLLETPLEAFDNKDLNGSVLTPNDRFFVRWHYNHPLEIDPQAHRLAIAGAVEQPQLLTLESLDRLPQTEVTAINQCAGNGRALSSPRVAGAQWYNGAVGNAVWRGPRLADVLALARPRADALSVRASGLDVPVMEAAPLFAKSLALDHVMAGSVILATHMNGEPLPLSHGAPIRLVVPGWYSTYWVKMLDRLEVLETPDESFWMAKAYRVADDTAPGGSRAVTAMRPRSFLTSHTQGSVHTWAERVSIRGIAMGGDIGVKRVEVSADDGRSWVAADLGPDHGPYSFRRFAAIISPARGGAILRARTTNQRGETQPLTANWNAGGFERDVAEPISVTFVHKERI